MRPVGSDDRPITPRQSNVGDGRAPSADVRVLKSSGVNPAPSPVKASAKQPAGSLFSAARKTPSPAGAAVAPGSARTAALPAAAGFPGAAAAELRASLRLPADGASYAAMASMMGERMALDAQKALAISRAVRLRNDDPAAARLTARALAAGLDPDDPAVLKVIDAIGSSDADADDGGPPSGDAGSPGREAPHGKRRDSGSALAEAAENEAGIVDQHDMASSLAMSAAAALGDPDLAALASPGPAGSGWACIPFETTVAGMNFHGFYRIWYYSKGGPVGRLIADIRFGGERRLLELHGGGGDAGIAYYADDERERGAFMAEFGGAGDVTVSRLEAGDLFELASRRSVDEDA